MTGKTRQAFLHKLMSLIPGGSAATGAENILGQDNKNPVSNISVIPVMAISLTAARISLAGTVVFLILVAALHFLKPDLDPSWRFISEYAIGDFGWVMKIAFFFWAIGYAGLFVAIRTQVSTLGGKIGALLLLVIAAAIVLAGIFVADPVTATDAERTTHGALHGLGGMIGINGTPIAALLVSYGLSKNPDWHAASGVLKVLAHFTWITVVILTATLFLTLSQADGVFGPSVVVGWPNRVLATAFCAWLIAVAWNAIKLRKASQMRSTK